MIAQLSRRTLAVPLSLALLALSVAPRSQAETSTPVAGQSQPEATSPPQVNAAQGREQASYSLGLSFATQWRDTGLDGLLSEPDLIRGIRAGLSGTALTPEDRKAASAFMHSAYEAWGGRNKAAAAEFLAHNALQPGVKTTASGLQYLIMTPGDPKSAAAGLGDHVTVQYSGRLLSGTEFDNSYTRGKPSVVRPSDVIAGWREALEMMNPGAKWRVFVPP